MSTFGQTMLPATVTALVAGRVAVTRTGRLRVGNEKPSARIKPRSSSASRAWGAGGWAHRTVPLGSLLSRADPARRTAEVSMGKSVDRGAHGPPGALRCDRKQENDHEGGRRLAREQEEPGG
jgi:hypothetical protein